MLGNTVTHQTVMTNQNHNLCMNHYSFYSLIFTCKSFISLQYRYIAMQFRSETKHVIAVLVISFYLYNTIRFATIFEQYHFLFMKDRVLKTVF